MTKRVTVILTDRSAYALGRLARKYSNTDATNRAIQFYDWLERQLDHGKELAIYDPDKEEFQLVHLDSPDGKKGK